ncbi:MAG: hypothetical protein JST22_15085 [Bacteroidetes bacterium]|nr:hypothetical protein [Bacteroidota bacterium]
MKFPVPLLRALLLATAFAACARDAAAQNLPDRAVVLDPLGNHAADTNGFAWLNAMQLYGEFSRYSNGSGAHHRWNAKSGGFIEFARWDSTWSIGMMGTMEMVADAASDIGFNPRAIFWEEGILASVRLNHDAAFQFGYMHRCKHDVDNLEPYLYSNRIEQYTLIYSGLTTRLLLRPRLVADGPVQLFASAAARNDAFLHLYDERHPQEAERTGRNMYTLADALNLTARIDARPHDARYGLHLSAGSMLSLFGSGTDLGGRWRNLQIETAVPFVELGLDLFNPRAGAFTVFARGEWQRDGAIDPFTTAARLFAVGIRATNWQTMW